MLFGKLFTNPKMWVNGDADEITMGGVYTCKDVQNVPTGDGALFVFKTEDTVKQVFVPVGEEGVVYTRVIGEDWSSVTGTSEETEALIQSAIDKANQAQAKADTVDTRLNNIIVESGTSDAEVVAARTDSNGKTYSTLGQRLDTQFGNINEDLYGNNSYNIFDTYGNYYGGTSRGATLTWGNNHVGTITRAEAASAATVFGNIIGNINEIPAPLVKGETYTLQANITDNNVQLQLMEYRNGNATSIFVGELLKYTVPNDIDGILFRVYVKKEFSGTATIRIKMLNAPTNKMLGDILDLHFNSLVDLNSMSFSDAIRLPVEKSYLEGITRMGEYYYAACRDFTSTPNSTYVAIYSSTFSLINYIRTNDTYGIANNITNDGTRIYIDYDNGYHVSFDANITNDYAVQNTAFRNIAFWNGMMCGIAINANTIAIHSLSSSFTIIDTLCTVNTERQTLQSSQIIDEILYVPTTHGLFKFVDISSGKLLAEVPYYSSKEIECFFKDADGSIKCAGHFYGTDGIFNIGSFVHGIDYPEMRYAPIDTMYGTYNLWGDQRYGFYKITNGLVAGLPADTGDLIIFSSLRLFCSLENDAIYSYNKGNNTWMRIGGLRKSVADVAITIGSKTSPDSMQVERNGASVSVKFMFQTAHDTTAISSGNVIGNIPVGFRPTMERWCCATVRDSSGWAVANYYPVVIKIDTNGDVSLFGNETYLTSAWYIWFADSYIVA